MGMMWMSVVEGMRGKICLGTGVWSSLVKYCTTLERIDDHQSTFIYERKQKSSIYFSMLSHTCQTGRYLEPCQDKHTLPLSNIQGIQGEKQPSQKRKHHCRSQSALQD